MIDPEEKLIRAGDTWHIAAKDRFSWPKSYCKDVPEASVEGVEKGYVTFIAWGDREGNVVCYLGQEQQIADLPEVSDV